MPYGEEEQHGSFQHASFSSHSTHQDAESDALSAYPSASSLSAADSAAQDPAAVAGDSLANVLRPSSSSQAAALTAITNAASSPDERLGHASSSGIGRADSADASLEALLAELSSASATAAATLAPFTTSSAAAAAASSAADAASPSASSVYVQIFDGAQLGKAQHGKEQHCQAQRGNDHYK